MKASWEVGSIFVVQQSDMLWTVGQVLDLMMINCPSSVVYNIRISQPELADRTKLTTENDIAAINTTRDLLDAGIWKVIGCGRVKFPRRSWPNEALRKRNWIGATTHGSGIVQNFLNAYHGLLPWDMYKDPNYFDKLLLSPSLKPKRLIYKEIGS